MKFSPENQPNMEFEHPRALGLARKMEAAQEKSEMKELVGQFIECLEADMGFELSSEVSELYREMEEQHQLVRLEQLSKILESLDTGKPLHLGNHEDHYANAVVPKKEGLQIAFAEGEAPGPIRFLIGFDIKSAIGFDPEGLQVSDIEISEDDPRDKQLRVAYCRHVSGNLDPENIKVFILRIPRAFFPVQHLTEEEKKNQSSFIFRGGHVGAAIEVAAAA